MSLFFKKLFVDNYHVLYYTYGGGKIMTKKESLMQSEEYIIFKNILYRKRISISQFVSKYKTNRENIRRAFIRNKTERIKELMSQAEAL